MLSTIPYAKTDRDGGTRSLLGHCADVAVAFDCLVTPRLQLLLRVDDVQRARLAVLAGMHDLGKALPAWQRYIRGGPRIGHVSPALAALLRDDPDIIDALGVLPGWFDDPAAALYTVVCHHGGPVPEHTWRQQPKTTLDTNTVRQLLDDLLVLFPHALEETSPITFSSDVQHLFAGLLMMADWRASSLRLDGPELRPAYVRATVHEHLPKKVADTSMGITGLRPMQEAAAKTGLSRVMLIEDVTGTGKTEAALMLALRHIAEGNAEAIRWCVPTRSAASQLYERITTLSQAAMPGAHVVRALPGDLEAAWWDGEGPKPWAISGSRMTGCSTVSVGTVDQALLGILRIRGAWARRAMDQRSVLVIDEVHAGDPLMLALVELLVQHHPGPVVLLSATLTAAARSRLLGGAADVGAAYPALWSGSEAQPVAVLGRRSVRIDVVDIADEEIVAAARAGATVLVIRSTVKEALEDHARLTAFGLRPLLHHSRYSREDRLHLDDLALAPCQANVGRERS